jgi:hypothetical protein
VDGRLGLILPEGVTMHKVDAVLAIVQAHISIHQDRRVDHVYAQIAANHNQLQSLLEGLPDDADVLSNEAVLYALGFAGKPHWMAVIGL